MITTTRVRPFLSHSLTPNESFARNGFVCTRKHSLHKQTLRNDQECGEQRKTRNPGGHSHWALRNTPIHIAPPPTHNSSVHRASSQEVTPACLTMPRECESSLSFKSHLMVQQTTVNTDCISLLSSPSNILRSPPY